MYLNIRYLTEVRHHITLQFMMERKTIIDAEETGGCMKSMMLTVKLCMFLAFALIPSIASADWGFNFGDNGWNPAGTMHYNFSKIDFIIPNIAENAGITWSGNGVSNFSQAGWSAQRINSNYIVATGPAVGIMFWDVLFTNSSSANFKLDYVLYTDSGLPAFGINMTIPNGTPNFTENVGWAGMSAPQLQTYSASSVPVPSAILLLGTGLVGITALRKRIHW
jgi:hypothetical protein